MSEAAILQIINLALYAPELAMKIQRLLMIPNPTQADWDVLWTEWARTPAEIMAAARARAGLPPLTLVPAGSPLVSVPPA